MHLYTDYLEAVANTDKYQTYMFMLFDVTSYDQKTGEITVTQINDWDK